MSDEILDQLEQAERNSVDEELEGLDIAAARKLAKLYNVGLSREMRLDEIKAAIKNKLTGKRMVQIAKDNDGGPGPGRWRIIVHKDPTIGVKAGSRPVYVGCNGYRCAIPRGVAVDVPEKVVRILENSRHYTTVMSDDPGEASRLEPVLSYPFQVVAMNPGPDPVPGYEKTKAQWYGARKRFRDKFGYWPRNQQMLRDAIKDGHIEGPVGFAAKPVL